MWAVVALGAAALLYSAGTLPLARLDLRFLLLGLLVCISSHVAVRIPRVSGRITVSDTLIFLTLLLYGGAAAVLLSTLEGVYASLRISRFSSSATKSSSRSSTRPDRTRKPNIWRPRSSNRF